MKDENWRILGLTDIATAASLKDSVFMPLISGDKTLGYLQVAHHRNGPMEFSKTELRLIKQAADQAAAALANFTLVHQARRNGLRAEALQRLGSISSSSEPLEKIIGKAIQEIGRLFDSTAGSIFILEDARGMLESMPRTSFGLSETAIDFFPRVSIDDPAYRSTVTSTHKGSLSTRLSSERGRQSMYTAIITSLHLESMIVSPLIVRGRCSRNMLASPNADWFDASTFST
jgi:GAF domain-containing protein